MPHMMKVPEGDVFGKGKYQNASGNTECVEFVRQVTDLGPTSGWKPGAPVSDMKSSISSGTAIATFDDKGNYPTDSLGRHAAIFLSRNSAGITVLDQWNSQGEVKKRVIKFSQPANTKRSNNGDKFFVIK